ncbi:hypothetical protein [Magnetospirillum molischianum]|uniref:Uncharacterized protein n=1 Tax=Magnetospirillum molischianum DSM 120 TaxID=1150626 RepID=H8FYD3_MAGML|nr:hypothetical protein [Magnetospirillum molischianum]CCG43371.1 hypothetical protein PHAMO_80162 [Magnetospirillum molischianum DSM 120]
MKTLFRSPSTLSARKTVADVLAGFSRVIDDLQTVQRQNEQQATEAQARIERAKVDLDRANGEITAAGIAIDNITNLIGGDPKEKFALIAAE